MKERPPVKVGVFVRFGVRDAIVSIVYKEPYHPHAEIELIFIDDRNRAISADAYWDGECWASEDHDRGYADRYDRLQELVERLRHFLYVKSKPYLWKELRDHYETSY